ncbi:MAG: methyltransferase family protein [Pelagimonas sp.]|uniref:methyltransferase family protein n=1 Tax=Pelagimonas sp. TaxID=2073170 RepID=UPI003D6A2F83
MAQTGGVSREHDPSLRQKWAFAALHGSIVACCAWVAFGGLSLGDPIRAKVLALCAALYFLRHLITLFVLLKRNVAWSEVLGLSGFIAVFEIGFVLLGGKAFGGEPSALSALDLGAVALVLTGSWLNTWSELQRWFWKKLPGSKGRAYTLGLFGHSMHINYFGDSVLFFGWALLTHSVLAFAIPLLMTVGFVFYHIPGLDTYLVQRYGAEFKSYSERTAKFVPYLY